MHVAMIGSGYVGLVSGACFSEFGVEVTCVDMDEDKIAALRQGRVPIYEPRLESLVAHNAAAGRLKFSTDLKSAVGAADVVFIAVGTPTRRGDGHADLTHVYAAAEEIAAALDGYTLVVTKSTVPVGTSREVEAIIRRVRPEAEVDVASNPEFLREGSAIEDFMRPDRVVIGTESARAIEVMRALYRPLYLIETPIVFTGRETAELIKYAANSFLAIKITFINEIADLCENVGADVHDVARAIGLDGRIGPKFLHPGPGYGGSCFPKDTLALVRTAPGARRPATSGRDHGRGQRGAQEGHGLAGHRRLRRVARGQDRGGAGPHLQTQHRRHARQPEPGDHPGPHARRGHGAGLRSEGPGGGQETS